MLWNFCLESVERSPICWIGMEDIQHCLFTCPCAMEIWSELGLADDIRKAVAEDRSGSVTMEILGRVQAAVCGLLKAELIAVAAWYIWWQRRQFVKGERIQAPDRSAISIKVLCTNFSIHAQTTNQKARSRVEQTEQSLSPLPMLHLVQVLSLPFKQKNLMWQGNLSYL